MGEIYAKGEVCLGEECQQLSQLSKIMADSKDFEERKYVWQVGGWEMSI